MPNFDVQVVWIFCIFKALMNVTLHTSFIDIVLKSTIIVGSVGILSLSLSVPLLELVITSINVSPQNTSHDQHKNKCTVSCLQRQFLVGAN